MSWSGFIAFVAADFDETHGPRASSVHPPSALTSEEASDAALCAFHDAGVSHVVAHAVWDTSFCCRTRRTAAAGAPASWLFVHAVTRELRGPGHGSRGASRRALMLVCASPLPALFPPLVDAVAAAHFRQHSGEALDVAAAALLCWPAPRPIARARLRLGAAAGDCWCVLPTPAMVGGEPEFCGALLPRSPPCCATAAASPPRPLLQPHHVAPLWELFVTGGLVAVVGGCCGCVSHSVLAVASLAHRLAPHAAWQPHAHPSAAAHAMPQGLFGLSGGAGVVVSGRAGSGQSHRPPCSVLHIDTGQLVLAHGLPPLRVRCRSEALNVADDAVAAGDGGDAADQLARIGEALTHALCAPLSCRIAAAKAGEAAPGRDGYVAWLDGCGGALPPGCDPLVRLCGGSAVSAGGLLRAALSDGPLCGWADARWATAEAAAASAASAASAAAVASFAVAGEVAAVDAFAACEVALAAAVEEEHVSAALRSAAAAIGAGKLSFGGGGGGELAPSADSPTVAALRARCKALFHALPEDTRAMLALHPARAVWAKTAAQGDAPKHAASPQRWWG